ncbi:phage tail protein, partial [Streptomyces sp. A73]|nr:phage tail protein [Streptomyces sp. A73]
LVYGFDEDNEAFTPWGLTSPVRTVVTSSVRTFGVTLWETARVAVQSVMYRIPEAALEPDGTGITSFAETASPQPDRRAWWFLVM